MTPLIESMRSCRISSDSPAECDARQDVSNNEMTKKRLFTIPEKVVPVMNECETIIMSTPPPPPSPPSHSWYDEKKMSVVEDAKIDTKTTNSSKPRFENGRWIWDDDDESVKSNPASVSPPTSFSFSKKKRTLKGLDALLQPPRAKFLVGREPVKSVNVIASTTVSAPPPPPQSKSVDCVESRSVKHIESRSVKHIESRSVERIKRESISSRTMALAATTMFGIAAIGSIWTFSSQHSATLSSPVIMQKPLEHTLEEMSMFEEKDEFTILSEDELTFANESLLQNIDSIEEEMFCDKNVFFEEDTSTKQLVVYTSPSTYFNNIIIPEEDYSNKMLWKPLPSPYKMMNMLLSKRYNFDNTFIFEETRSIRVSVINQDITAQEDIIEEPQNVTQEGDHIVRFRDATLKPRCRLVDRLDLRDLTPRKQTEVDVMVRKIMRGQSIVRRALVDSLHLENAVMEYRGILAYENELAKMRAAREEKKRKEKERIRRKLDNFAMLMSDVKESIVLNEKVESIENIIVQEKKSSSFNIRELFTCLLSSILGFGVVAFGMHVSVWLKEIRSNEIVVEEDSMFDCEDKMEEDTQKVTSHRQSRPVVLPGIQDVPSQPRYNFRPRTPIDYSERRPQRRRRCKPQVQETPKHTMSHITLPLSAFGRLEQNTMISNCDSQTTNVAAVMPERIPPQTARPRCAKRRLTEISSSEVSATPQPRRSARLAKRRRRVLQTPLMFSQQTPVSTAIPTPLPFSVNTPRF